MGYCARDGSGDGKAHYFPRVNLGPVIDHVADSNARLSLTAEGVVVSGAGAPLANGTYTQRGTLNGKPYYNLTSNPDSTVNNQIAWDGTQWTMYGALYVSPDDTVRPDLAVFVPAASHGGALPAPTVTHSPGQVTGAGYQVIQDDDGLTYTFNNNGADADAGLRVTGAGSDWNGPYTFDGSLIYYRITDNLLITRDEHTGFWSAGADYIGADNVDYAWQTVTWAIGLGDPPTLEADRNPIASLANWSHP